MVKLRVRELAEARGMNIQDLANQSKIAYSSALDLWYDRVQRIDKKTIGKVAKALGVQPGELFGELEDRRAARIAGSQPNTIRAALG